MVPCCVWWLGGGVELWDSGRYGISSSISYDQRGVIMQGKCNYLEILNLSRHMQVMEGVTVISLLLLLSTSQMVPTRVEMIAD